jgi:hypothetical protein
MPGPSPASAPLTANNLNFACDWRFGFNLDSKKKAPVGYLLFWSGCGGLTLSQDIEVWNPFSSPGQTILSGSRVACVGLIEQFHFDGGESDPMRLSVFVSKGTAANVRAKLVSPLTNTKLKLAFYIIGFDDEKKIWYESALIKDATCKVDAVLDTVGGDLQLFVATDPTAVAEHLDIQVYKLEFQVVPAIGKTAHLEFATGPTTRVVRLWQGEGE